MRWWYALLLLFAAPLAAQETRTCIFVLDEAGGTGVSTEIRPGVYHQFAGGGVTAHCKGDVTRMKSDSVAWFADLNRMDLVGRVHFTDSTVTLDANKATYFVGDERLEAYGKVVLVNRRTNSTLSGPNLVYRRRAPPLRDTAELYATSRPTVQYHAETDTAGSEPYVIVGERIRLKGNSKAWAAGTVTIDRSDFRARGDSAVLDLEAGNGELVNHAVVAGSSDAKYELTGRVICYRLDGRDLKWVQARGLAEAVSADWRLVADTVEFDIASRHIQGGRAWTDTMPARAISANYTIRADSLAIDSPDQRLKEVRGFRHGIATSKADSLQIEADWMAGDTLVARFDTTALGQRILSRLTARGDARAYYHVADPDHPKGPPGITYSRGKQIAARFTLVGLERVDVVGGGDGVYLEPGSPQKARGDSLAAPPAEKPPEAPSSVPLPAATGSSG